jgi:hypothetical protein
MGLFDFLRIPKVKNEPDQPERACDLPSGWLYENRKFTQISSERHHHLLSEVSNARKEKKGVRAEYAALKSLVPFLEDQKKVCESRGTNFVRWYSLFVADSDTLAFHRDRLNEMEDNLDELIRKENLSKKLKKELVDIIKKEPGVVQADLYKRFDAELKGDISTELYSLSASGVITREKSGRSYKLYIG